MRDYAFFDLASPEREEGPGPVLAIGVFDGVHIGHQSLLDAGRTLARQAGRPFWVLTFWPHPEMVLGRRGGSGPLLLSTLDEKASLLRQCGAEQVLVLRFTPDAAALAPEEFVRVALAGSIRPKAVIVGFNFTFGRGGRGDSALLRDLGGKAGIEVVVHPAVRLGGRVVSSSAVRAALTAGDTEQAGLLLGRPYSLGGRVERGAGRGRRLGFPTINVTLPEGLISPPAGVYVCSVSRSGAPVLRPAASGVLSSGEVLPAVANIGTCPTFTAGETAPPVRLEAHILAGEPPTYGDSVRVFFFRRLRPERAFAGPRELAAQISLDRAAALGFFGLGPGGGPPAGERGGARA